MLRPLEKELVFFGASVAAGCKPCMNYHVEQLRAAGATDDEIRLAIADATHVRNGVLQIQNDAIGPAGPCLLYKLVPIDRDKHF